MYIIGSFNLCKLNFQSDNERKKSFENIANIIIKENFDVIALQEVLSEQACKELLRHLGPSWDRRWNYPRKSSSNAAEGYAFLWNTRTMGLAKNDNGKEFEPTIVDGYRVIREKGQVELIRNPYYGRFSPNHLPKVEFRLLNVHLRFSKDNELELSAIKQRNNEFDVLTEIIYPKYEDKRYGNNNSSYTFILGDYNLNIVNAFINDGRDRYCPLKEEVIVGNKKIITVQDKLTTLKSPEKDKADEGNRVEINDVAEEKIKDDIKDVVGNNIDYYANNYDHFTYNAENAERVFLQNDRVEAVGTYYKKDYVKFRKEISDHVPIKLMVEPNTNKVLLGGIQDVY